MYKSNGESSVIRKSDGAIIPLVSGNRDYEEYKNWLDDGGIPEPEQPNEYSVWDETSWAWVEDVELKAAYDARIASQLRDEAMMHGFIYGTNPDGTDRYVSVTKDDGDGMVQVEAIFKRLKDAIANGELPSDTLIETVIHFKNGTKLPIAEAEFNSFSLQFIIERGKFFQ